MKSTHPSLLGTGEAMFRAVNKPQFREIGRIMIIHPLLKPYTTLLFHNITGNRTMNREIHIR